VRAIVNVADAPRVSGDDLVAVAAGGVAALASRRPGAPDASEGELRAHDAIAHRVHDRAPSLPSRFGQLYSDEAALADALRTRAAALETTLASIGTRVELSITLSWGEPRAVPNARDVSSGRAYLEIGVARERERREAEDLATRLVAELAVEPAFIRQRCCPRDGVAAIVTLLVTREEVNAVRHRAQEFAERTRVVRADVYGPLPPYTFAS
jgi:gas vesicle protein GvpL/GvpF